MKPISRTFDYTSAEDSRKPGYLSQRMKKYAQRQREEAEQRARDEAEAKAKTTSIQKKVA